MKNKIYRVVGAFLLFSVASVVSSQDVPIELGDGGSVDYYQNYGSINHFYNQNLLTQDLINRMLDFGMDLDMEITLTYARLGTVITEQIANGLVDFDPEFPEHGDTSTSRGTRQQGELVYEYVITNIYLVTANGGGWYEMDKSKRLTEVPPPVEDDVDDGGN